MSKLGSTKDSNDQDDSQEKEDHDQPLAPPGSPDRTPVEDPKRPKKPIDDPVPPEKQKPRL